VTDRKNKIIKIILQIIFFIWIPESFSVSLYALKTLVRSCAQGQFDHIAEPVLILLGTVVAAIFFGRYYCGYICAFGAMQDLSYDVRGLVSKKKRLVPARADAVLSKIKYLILAAILILAALGIGIPGEISPWTCFGSLTSFVKGHFDIQNVLTAGLVILLAIVVITAFYFRVFCRYLCPVGALYSLVSAFSHDRRTKPCKNSGDCSICPYKCRKYRIHYPGLIAAVVIFVGMNLFLTFAYEKMLENEAAAEAEVSVSAEEVITENAAEDDAAGEAEDNAENTENAAEETPEDIPEETDAAGPYADGTYEGAAKGYRGDICVSVVVENGTIVSIEVTDHSDDKSYFRSVERTVIGEILETQSADVDTVSGATYSSRGLIGAVKQALGLEEEAGTEAEESAGNDPDEETDGKTAGNEIEETDGETAAEETEAASGTLDLDLSHLEDGVYEGTGIGFRGEIEVAVTVKDHAVESVRIISYYDNDEYLFHASQPVIDEAVSGEALDVDAVSGATYSSNGLTRAIADALQVDEDVFVILEAKPRAMKNKESHHVTQKFIESDEQYEELVEKYGELMYGADGKKIR